MNIDVSGLTLAERQEVERFCSECKLKHTQHGQEVLQQAGVAYLDPTFDRTFKWLMGPDNFDIARTICKSLMFLTNKSLATRGIRSIRSLSTETDKRSEQLSKLPGSAAGLLMMDVPVELDLFADLYGFNQTIIEEISSILNNRNNTKADIKQNLEKLGRVFGDRIRGVLPQTGGKALPDHILDSLRGLRAQLEGLKNSDPNNHNAQIDNVQALLNNLEETISSINGMISSVGQSNQWLCGELLRESSRLMEAFAKQLSNPKIKLKDIRTQWERDWLPVFCERTNASVSEFIDAIRRQLGDNFSLISRCHQTWVTLADDLSGIEGTEEMTSSIKNLKADYDNALAIDEEIQAIAMTNIPRVPDKNEVLQKELQPLLQLSEQIEVGLSQKPTKDKLIQVLQQWRKSIANASIDIGDLQEILKRFNVITMDIEMQRKKDCIEKRLFQYEGQLSSLKDEKNLLPLVSIAVCSWGNPKEVIRNVLGGVLDKESNGALPIFQETIYLQTASSPIGKNDSQRKSERKRIKDIFKTSLRQRYPELIKDGESFKSLSVPQEGDDVKTQIEKRNLRTAHEVLCFLRLAPLTPQLADVGFDKDQNPDKAEQLGENILRTRIFNPEIREAYNLMKTNNVNTPGAQEQYLGIWSEQERIKEMEQTAQQNTVNSIVDSALSATKYMENESIANFANDIFSKLENLEISDEIIAKIENKASEFGREEVANIFRTAYSRILGVRQDRSDENLDQAALTDSSSVKKPERDELPPRERTPNK